MRKISTLLLLLLGSIAGKAQHPNGPPAEFIYDLTYDFLIPTQEMSGLSQQWFSNGHTFSFMGEVPFNEASGLGYGFGFSVHNLHNNLAFTEVEPRPSPVGNVAPLTLAADSSYNINEQNLSYLEIPLEFRYRGKSSRKGGFFRMSLGARFGYRVLSAAYHRDEDHAIRQYRVHTTSPWRIQTYFRIGYGKVTFFAGYDVLPNMEALYRHSISLDSPLQQYHMASAGVSLLL